MQSQVYKQHQESTSSLLAEKSDNELFLKAPYTVFAKRLDSDLVSWVAYSIGRPRNIVWGTAIQNDPSTVSVEFGCNWNSLNIINKLIEIRKKNGYVAISTYAKDRISHRILEHLLLSAYNEGSNLEYGNVVLDKYQLQDLVLQELDEHGLLESSINVMSISNSLTRKLLISSGKSPNKKQTLHRIIPIHVVDAIHKFISHTPILNSTIPDKCPMYEQCQESEQAPESCKLYPQSGYGLL
jgi:hypothetical protein